jgi:2,3-bisphosphoglycerate-independent phosphoglycerate mutase
MPLEDCQTAEITGLGETIYQERIKHLVEPTEKGKFLVIDVESGDYEIDSNDATASRRLLERRPDAVIYGLRVGYRAAYSLGGGSWSLQP